MKIGTAGDKIVGGKPLITTLLKRSGEDACEVKIKKRFCLSWPRKIEILRWPDIGQIKECDIIHAVFPFHTFETIIIAKLFRKRVIYHWIGTDVWYLLGNLISDFKNREYNRFIYKLFYKFLGHFADYHLCGSGNLKDELSLMGIKADVVPMLPLDVNIEITPLPKNLAVYSYLPATRHEFYGSRVLVKLAKEFPQIKFLITGSVGRQNLPNIKCYPLDSDIEKLYRQSTIIFRLPEHDGMSLIVLEALLRGKQVIWNYKFPYCHYATNFKEAKGALKKNITQPTLNYEGANYIKTNFDPKDISKKLINIYQTVLK